MRSLTQLLGDLTAVSAALCRRAERLRPDQLGFFQQRPSSPLGGALVGGDRVRTSVHHAGVEAVGHGERLQVRLESQREGELINQVDGGAGDDGATAEILKTQHFVGSPQSLHAVSHQDDASELSERLGDVEVTQRADLEEGDAQLLRVHLRLLRGHLTLVGQVETVPNQDFGHPRGMLVYLFDPPVDSIKGPAVGDVVHQYDALCSSGVGPENGAESSLTRRVPELQLDSAAVQQDGGRLTVDAHVVSVRGLAGSVLQARQDLALPDVAVAHQQELEQEVVRPGRAASVAHPQCPIMR